MRRQYEWNQIYVLKNVEVDHEACNVRIGRFVARISYGFDHRILRVFAIPSVSEIEQKIILPYE